MLRVASDKPCTIVYSLCHHEYLGFLIEPYIVQLNSQGGVSLTCQKLFINTAKEFDQFLDETDYKLIKILGECEQEYIIRKYFKKPIRPAVFFPAHYNEKLHAVVRPNIERRIGQALDLLSGKQVYIMSKSGNPADVKLSIAPESASVLFHFRRNETGTRYFPTIKYQDRRIEFMFKNAEIICNQPAWMLLGNTLHYFEDELDGKKLQPFLNKRFIEIPSSSEPTYYQKFIIPLLEKHDVYAEGFDIVTQQFEAQPILKVTQVWNGEYQLILHFKYDDYIFPYKSTSKVSVSLSEKNGHYTFHRIKRSLQWEKGKADVLIALGLKEDEGASFLINSQERQQHASYKAIAEEHENTPYSIYDWLNSNSQALSAKGFILKADTHDKEYFIGSASINLDIRENNDWFDVQAIVTFGTYQFPFIELRSHILNKKREFVLPSGEIAIIPETWFSTYANLFSFSNSIKEIRLKKHHVGLVQEYAKDNLAVLTMDRKLHQLTNFDTIDEVKIPEKFKGSLRPYQKAGYDWLHFLRKFNFGGCLADDMGLGKTVQVLAFLQKLKEEHEAAAKDIIAIDTHNLKDISLEAKPLTTLIVMPTSLIYNWQNEAKKFAPNLKIAVYTGFDREKDVSRFVNYDIVLTTYGIVRWDKEILKEFYFHYIILDESQVIKNPLSKINKAIKLLKGHNRLVLSGTPIENSIVDLWSQMSFLNPGLLGQLPFFKDEFVVPIEKKKDEERANELQALIKPFVMRRTKQQVAADLPEKIEHVYYCDMDEEQEKVYEETKAVYRNQVLEKMTAGGISQMHLFLLQGLNKLRQIANHPSMVDEDYNASSGKFKDILLVMENAMAKGHRILVFSQFVKHLTLFRNHLDLNEVSYAYLDGSTVNREAEVNRFRDNDGIKLFLISIKAGGLGLNLVEADYVFILDPWWNPAVEQQAIDRSHRIGQTKNVFIYKFITRNSVEEKILALQERKLKLANTIITMEDSFIKSLTEDDIKAILA